MTPDMVNLVVYIDVKEELTRLLERDGVSISAVMLDKAELKATFERHN